MTRLFIILLTLNFFSVSSAKAKDYKSTLESDISDMANEIQYRINKESFDKSTLLSVQRLLKQALKRMDQTPSTAFSCVSKDNDGYNPWIISRMGKKIVGSVIGSQQDCEKVLNNRIEVGQDNLFCGSKDDDGYSPFQVIAVDRYANTVKLNAVGSLENCLQTLANTKVSKGLSKTCVSKDNDGHSPWTIAYYDGYTHTSNIDNGAIYRSLEDCLRSL